MNATSINVPRSCLQQPTYEDNVFKLVLSTDQVTCPVEWIPLDVCRKYRLEFKSVYSYSWTGVPSNWETFVSQTATGEAYSRYFLVCMCVCVCMSIYIFYTSSILFIYIIIIWVLSVAPLIIYFVLFSTYTDYSHTSCSQSTAETGSFPMQEKPPSAPSFHKTIILISVQTNHTIWLAFNRFHITGNHFIEVILKKIYRLI